MGINKNNKLIQNTTNPKSYNVEVKWKKFYLIVKYN